MKKLFIVATSAIALLSSTTAMAAGGTHNMPAGNFGTANLAYNANVAIPNDTTDATPTVTENFTLTGNVAKDCSFWDEGTQTHNISIGAIGVKNGNNEAVSNLFNQAGDFSIEITTTSAGCNFNNTVTVAKSVAGLQHQGPASGFDNTQFTDHIPYSVKVGIHSATANQTTGAVGAFVGTTVATTDASQSLTLGAWRSSLDLQAQVPAQTLGLVAGNYSDTITVTLAAM